MWRYTGLKNLLRLAKTRFATAFIALSSIYKQQDNLRKMFVSDDWTSSKWAKGQAGKKAAQSVLTYSFWVGIIYALKVTGPLIRVLRLVDGEKKPAMGYIYEAMDQATIAASFNDSEKHKYESIYSIIDKRWDCQLHRPLHAAGYYLNPEFYYNDLVAMERDKEVNRDLIKCIERLVPSIQMQDMIMRELPLYQNSDTESLFESAMAVRHRKTEAPAEWWKSFEAETPNLQQFAIKVLSLTCSSSGCE
ncbi:hAT transposon superfamily [Quillaja saponaria]|uniref:HAT transposon superfamily n=1 Tax=Quillaja saponaria TaxID=32244 RepID=A0AAD7L2N7_QUISA|nr:hAT transposon superfamily [Quillaja saponaria]